MSWLGSSISNITGQLSTFTREILEPDEPGAGESPEQILKERLRSSESICMQQQQELDKLARVNAELESSLLGCRNQIYDYQQQLQLKEADIHNLADRLKGYEISLESDLRTQCLAPAPVENRVLDTGAATNSLATLTQFPDSNNASDGAVFRDSEIETLRSQITELRSRLSLVQNDYERQLVAMETESAHKLAELSLKIQEKESSNSGCDEGQGVSDSELNSVKFTTAFGRLQADYEILLQDNSALRASLESLSGVRAGGKAAESDTSQDDIHTLQQRLKDSEEALAILRSANSSDDRKELDGLREKQALLEHDLAEVTVERDSLLLNLEELDSQHQIAIDRILNSRKELQAEYNSLTDLARRQDSDFLILTKENEEITRQLSLIYDENFTEDPGQSSIIILQRLRELLATLKLELSSFKEAVARLEEERNNLDVENTTLKERLGNLSKTDCRQEGHGTVGSSSTANSTGSPLEVESWEDIGLDYGNGRSLDSAAGTGGRSVKSKSTSLSNESLVADQISQLDECVRAEYKLRGSDAPPIASSFDVVRRFEGGTEVEKEEADVNELLARNRLLEAEIETCLKKSESELFGYLQKQGLLEAENAQLLANLEQLEADLQEAVRLAEEKLNEELRQKQDIISANRKELSELQRSVKEESSKVREKEMVIQDQKSEIFILRDQVQCLESTKQGLLSSKRQVEDELVPALHGQIEELQAELEKLQKNNTNMVELDIHDKALEEMEQYKMAVAELNQQVRHLTEAGNGSYERCAQLEKLATELQQKWTVSEQQLATTREILRVYKENMTDKEEDDKLKILQDELKSLHFEKANMLQILNDKSKEMAGLKHETSNLMAAIAAEKQQSSALKRTIEEYEKSDEVRMQREAIQNMARLIRDKDLEIEALRGRNESLSAMIQTTEQDTRLIDLQTQKENVTLELAESMGRLRELAAVLENKTIDLNRLEEERASDKKMLASLGDERTSLITELEGKQKQVEDLAVEVQRRSPVLTPSADNTQTTEVSSSVGDSEASNTTQLEELKVEMGAMKEANLKMAVRCDQLCKEVKETSETKEDEIMSLKNQLIAAADVEERLKREIERLRTHLLTIEDEYTQEAVSAGDRECELKAKLIEAEDHVRASFNNFSSNNHQVVQHLQQMEARVASLICERETAVQRMSEAEDQVASLSASVQKLNLVLEHFQQEKNRDVHTLNNKHQDELRRQEARAKIVFGEIEKLQGRLQETNEALEAATRLSEQLDRKENSIGSLRSELQVRESALLRAHDQIRLLASSSEGTVDKTLIKGLIVGFFCVPTNQKSEALRVIATVLDFNQNDRQRIGLEGSNATSWISGWIKPSNSRPNSPATTSQQFSQSLSRAFVQFMQTESQPMSPPLPLKFPSGDEPFVFAYSPSARPITVRHSNSAGSSHSTSPIISQVMSSGRDTLNFTPVVLPASGSESPKLIETHPSVTTL